MLQITFSGTLRQPLLSRGCTTEASEKKQKNVIANMTGSASIESCNAPSGGAASLFGWRSRAPQTFAVDCTALAKVAGFFPRVQR